MSQRLKKKDSPTSLAFCSQSVIYLKKILENIDVTHDSNLLQVVECQTNGKDQLNILKLLSSEIKSSTGDDEELKKIPILCDMFIHCESKHPMRRCLASLLQHLSSNEKYKCEIMAQTSAKLLDFLLSQDEKDIRKNAETINSLMENFKLGDEVVRCNYLQVLLFLKASLEKSVELTRSSTSPVEQTKWIQHILALLKTAIAVQQKCDSVPTQLFIDSLSNDDALLCVNKIMMYSIEITTDVFFTLECQTAAAMLFVSFTTLLPSVSLNQTLHMICSYVIKEHPFQGSGCKNLTFESVVMNCVTDLLMKDLSPTCLLVYLNAILVKVPLHYLRHTTNEFRRGFFDELLIRKLIEISNISQSKTALVLAFKTIGVWINESLKEVKRGENSGNLFESVSTFVFPHLVLFVDHPVDTIRHIVKTSIKDCLTMLRLSDDCKIVDRITREYFYGNIKSRGKITMLINLAEFIQLCDVMNHRPDLPVDILKLLSDVDLATHACELYKVLSCKHLKELKCDSKSWKIFWVKQIHKPLFSGTKEMKTYIVNYVIPGLLQTNPNVILDLLSTTNAEQLEHIRTLIVFLKALRSMKNFSHSVKFDRLCGSTLENHNMWKNLLDMRQMKKCLVHIDDQVRFDTLALICDSVKCTDSVDQNDVILLQYFLQYNSACENSSFRQQTVTSLKKICNRIFTNAFQFEKNSADESKKHLGVYAGFLSWLTDHCFEKLYDDAPYCQLSMYLELTLLIAKLFSDNQNTTLVHNLKLTLTQKEKFTKILIHCFEDTYDPNRLLVYEIFRLRPVFCTNLATKELTGIFDDVLQRIASPQPDISSISAYLVNFLLLQVNSNDLKIILTTHQSEECRSVTWECSEDNSCDGFSTVKLLLDFLLEITKRQLSIMKTSLTTASQTAPMYGVLYCIRMLFQLQNINCQKEFVNNNRQRFSVYLEELVCIGLDIIELVSQYVSNEAPEGYLCDANLADVFEQVNISDVSANCIEIQAQIARMLLVCCWRSMKEVSLLLGIIVANFATVDQKESFLRKPLLLKMWHMFCNILLRSKHAGAYELASLGFIKLCAVLWSSNDVEVQAIPSDGVNTLVQELVSQEAFDNAQVTRRSAGLPFYLQALCTTEPAIKAKQSFKHLMVTLTHLCKHKIHSHDVNKIVISLNILRAFFKDAKLCEDVFPYVSDGVVIGITGFSSAVWPIRNSCTLLFSAMMQRIFGVKKFHMTGREFFSRFPSLYSFLMEQAKEMAAVNGGRLHPSLFPVLLMLSHLYPSTMDGNDSLMKLAEFIPYIRSCGSCSVYKSRTMAARAMVPLTTHHQAYDIMMEILLNPTLDDQNEIHGSLLQIRSLLKRYIQVFQDETDMKILIQQIHNAAQTFLHRSIAYTSKAVYIDILVDLFESTSSEINQLAVNNSLTEVLRTTVEARQSENLGYTIFLRSAISYIGVVFRENQNYVCDQFYAINNTKNLHPVFMLLVLTKSHCLEVQVKTLEMLVCYVKLVRSIPTEALQQLWEMVLLSDVSAKNYPQMLESVTSMLSVIDCIPINQLFQLWQRWHDNSILSNMSDDVRVAALKYVVMILNRSLDMNSNEARIDQLWKFIRESSEADQCVESRDQVARMLFLSSKLFSQFPKEAIWEYVRCSVNLLKDGDPSVRNETAVNLHRMIMTRKDCEHSFTPLPSFVLENFFKQIVKEMVQNQSIQSAELLLTTILDDNENEVVSVNGVRHEMERANASDSENLLQKFVVYERGKTNPYYDQQEIYNLCKHVMEDLK